MCLSKDFNIAINNSEAQVCLDLNSTKLKDIKEALLFPTLGARRMATSQCGVPAPLLWGFRWSSAIGDSSRSEGGREMSACLFPSSLHTRWWFPQWLKLSVASAQPQLSLNSPSFLVMTHHGFGDTFPSPLGLEEETVSEASLWLHHHPHGFHSPALTSVNSLSTNQASMEVLECIICFCQHPTWFNFRFLNCWAPTMFWGT